MCAYLPACPSSRHQALNADVAAACRTSRGPRYRHAGRDRGPLGQRHPPSPVRQPAPHSPCVLCAVHSTRMHYFCDCDLCCRACVLPSTGANCVCTLSLQTVASRRPRLPLGAPTSTSTSCSVRDKRPVRWTASDYFSSHSHFFFAATDFKAVRVHAHVHVRDGQHLLRVGVHVRDGQ